MKEAVSNGDLKRVQQLIQRGVNVNEAYVVDDPSGVRTSFLIVAVEGGHENVAFELLAAGADIHVKDSHGRTALHWACCKRLEGVAETLISLGSEVDEHDLSGHSPVMLAAESGNTAISMHLARAGASCAGLSEDHVRRLLFQCAYHETQGDLTAVRTLLEGSCSVGILSNEEQEELLLHACQAGALLVAERLIAHDCNVNCVSFDGYTPLMLAAQADHEEVIKKLIVAGANVGMRGKDGNTALHYAALYNRFACGILLVEAGASVMTKNKLSQTPLDLASAEFKETINQVVSFTTQKTLCVIGNAGSGKSTLIASLQAESNSNRFRRVSDRRQRTAGIETVSHSSQRYEEVLFFDFAGQDDYHGPHQMFLESLLSKVRITTILLLVVKMTEEEDAILDQLHHWLSPVALMATPASPPPAR